MDMNSQHVPLISVLMPLYNGEKYVVEAVESILNQSFRDFELLVMDDGSTDNSLNLLRPCATRDSRLRLIPRAHRGLGATQHELVELARGEFIAHMDSDDVSFPNRFELQLDFLRKNPEIVCVGAASQLIDSVGRYLTTVTPPQTNDEIQTLILSGHGAITHSTAMMRNAQLKSIGGYDKSFDTAEDLDLWLRLGEVGELANLKDVLLKYRLHDKSVSEMACQKQRNEALRACENAWRRRNVSGVFSAQNLWRPTTDKASRHEFMLKYGWWAWSSRQRKTAAIYGWKAIRVQPFAMAGWRLLLVALTKTLAGVSGG